MEQFIQQITQFFSGSGGKIAIIVLLVLEVLFLCAGFFRGMGRSLLRLGLVAAAVLVAFVVCRTALTDADRLADILLHNRTVADALASMGWGNLTSDIQQVFGDAASVVLSFPLALVLPFVFVVLTLVLTLLLYPVYLLFAVIIFGSKSKKRQGKKVGLPLYSRIIGLVVGLVQSAALFLITLMPFLGLLNVTANIYDMADSSPNEQPEAVETILAEGSSYRELYTTYTSFLAENPLIGRLADFGQTVYEDLSTVRYSDRKISIGNEVKNIAAMALDLAPLYREEVYLSQFGEAEKTAVSNFVSHVSSSELLPLLGSRTVAAFCSGWERGETVLGIPSPVLPENVAPIAETVIGAMAESDEDTFREDIHTLSSVFDLLVDHRLFAAFEGTDSSVLSALTSDGFLSDTLMVLYENPRMRAAMPDAAAAALMLALSSLDLPQDNEAIYQTLMETLSDAYHSGDHLTALNDRIEQIGGELYLAFDRYGLPVHENLAYYLAECMMLAFADDADGVNADDIRSFYTETATVMRDPSLSASDEGVARAAYALGVIKDLPTGESLYLDSLLITGKTYYITGGETADLSGLTSASEMGGLCLTMSKIRSDLHEAFLLLTLVGEDAEAHHAFAESETDLFEDAVIELANTLITIMDMPDYALEDIPVDGIDAATAIFATSQAFSRFAENMYTALLQSPSVQDSVPIPQSVITQLAHGDLLLSEFTETALALRDLLEDANSAAVTEQLLTEDVYWFFTEMAPSSSEPMLEMLRDPILRRLGFGLGDNDADYAFLMYTLMEQIAVARVNLPEEQKYPEANAVAYILDIFVRTSRNGLNDDALYGTEGNLIDRVMSSVVCTNTVIALSTDETGALVRDNAGLGNSIAPSVKLGCEMASMNYYLEHYPTDGTAAEQERFTVTLTAICYLLDCELYTDPDEYLTNNSDETLGDIIQSEDVDKDVIKDWYLNNGGTLEEWEDLLAGPGNGGTVPSLPDDLPEGLPLS